MTTPPVFPSLAGLGWSVHKKPTIASLVASHVSGREVRERLYQNPIWQFELTFEGLDSTTAGVYGGLGAASLQSLMGFFLQCGGQSGSFLYIDPTDSGATAQSLGTGDGSTKTFTFARSLGGFLEPVGWVTSVSQVTVGGVVQGSGWSLVAPNSLVFASAPVLGAAVAATFAFAFQCRFEDDTLDFEEFMASLWKCDSVKFRSVRSQ